VVSNATARLRAQTRPLPTAFGDKWQQQCRVSESCAGDSNTVNANNYYNKYPSNSKATSKQYEIIKRQSYATDKGQDPNEQTTTNDAYNDSSNNNHHKHVTRKRATQHTQQQPTSYK